MIATSHRYIVRRLQRGIRHMKKMLVLLIAAPFLQGCVSFCYDTFVPERRMSLLVTNEADQPLPQARLVVETRTFKSPKEGLPASEEGRIDVSIPGYMHGGGA